MAVWVETPAAGALEEVTMANKDKGGKSDKKAASQSLKEKRQAKKAKKSGRQTGSGA